MDRIAGKHATKHKLGANVKAHAGNSLVHEWPRGRLELLRHCYKWQGHTGLYAAETGSGEKFIIVSSRVRPRRPDQFYVAVITQVIHYGMGGPEET